MCKFHFGIHFTKKYFYIQFFVTFFQGIFVCLFIKLFIYLEIWKKRLTDFVRLQTIPIPMLKLQKDFTLADFVLDGSWFCWAYFLWVMVDTSLIILLWYCPAPVFRGPLDTDMLFNSLLILCLIFLDVIWFLRFLHLLVIL